MAVGSIKMKLLLDSPSLYLCFHSGLKEADDINLYLQPLKVLLEEMEQAEYPQVYNNFRNTV